MHIPVFSLTGEFWEIVVSWALAAIFFVVMVVSFYTASDCTMTWQCRAEYRKAGFVSLVATLLSLVWVWVPIGTGIVLLSILFLRGGAKVVHRVLKGMQGKL